LTRKTGIRGFAAREDHLGAAKMVVIRVGKVRMVWVVTTVPGSFTTLRMTAKNKQRQKQTTAKTRKTEADPLRG
jgi:hypothetical protein